MLQDTSPNVVDAGGDGRRLRKSPTKSEKPSLHSLTKCSDSQVTELGNRWEKRGGEGGGGEVQSAKLSGGTRSGHGQEKLGEAVDSREWYEGGYGWRRILEGFDGLGRSVGDQANLDVGSDDTKEKWSGGGSGGGSVDGCTKLSVRLEESTSRSAAGARLRAVVVAGVQTWSGAACGGVRLGSGGNPSGNKRFLAIPSTRMGVCTSLSRLTLPDTTASFIRSRVFCPIACRHRRSRV